MTIPKYKPRGLTVKRVKFDADFEEDARQREELIYMPSAFHFVTCTMRGHNGSFHSQNPIAAQRHAMYHDLHGVPNDFVTSKSQLVNRFGVRGNPAAPLAFDPTRHAYWLKTHHISKEAGGLVQKGFNAGPDPHKNFQRPALHTSWLQTIHRRYVEGEGSTIHDSRVKGPIIDMHVDQAGQTYNIINNGPYPDTGLFSKNVFFEMDVDYSKMKTGAHRHSWWWMTREANKSYNEDLTDGSEIDGIEHEVNDDPYFSDLAFIKCLAGGQNTINEIKPGIEYQTLEDGTVIRTGVDLIKGDEEAEGYRNGAIRIPKINQGRKIIGLLWEVDKKGKGRLRFFVDGVEVVRDSVIVPLRDTLMYMILSREGNEEHGLSGKNIFDFIDTIEEDQVVVYSVKAWETAQVDTLENDPVRIAENVDFETNPLASIHGFNTIVRDNYEEEMRQSQTKVNLDNVRKLKETDFPHRQLDLDFGDDKEDSDPDLVSSIESELYLKINSMIAEVDVLIHSAKIDARYGAMTKTNLDMARLTLSESIAIKHRDPS